MSWTEPALQALPREVRQTLRAYVTEVSGIFGAALEAVILYGSAACGDFLPGRSNLNLLLLLSQHEIGSLQRYAEVHRRWSKEHIVVPLFLTEAELRASLDLFPLEYLEIREQHVLLMGRDPFPGLRLELRRLRAHCEQEIHGNLVRLRQRFVEGGGQADAAMILLPLSLTGLLPCLRGLFRALEIPAPRSADALLGELKSALGVEPAVFQEVLHLKRGVMTPGPLAVPRLFERYVSALQVLVERTDQLRPRAPESGEKPEAIHRTED